MQAFVTAVEYPPGQDCKNLLLRTLHTLIRQRNQVGLGPESPFCWLALTVPGGDERPLLGENCHQQSHVTVGDAYNSIDRSGRMFLLVIEWQVCCTLI